MKAANSLKADNYRKSGSHATCCRACEHFVDNGPYRRLCRIHQLGPASAHSGAVTPTVAAYNICDKFMPKLRECPFCGGEAEIHEFSCDDYTTAWAGSCKDDDCPGWVTANYFHSAHSLKEAVERWNRRAGGGGEMTFSPEHPGPWSFDYNEDTPVILDADGDPVVAVDSIYQPPDPETARKIVEAMNERDRLRDLVQRLAEQLHDAVKLTPYYAIARDLLRDARAALGEGETPTGKGER